MHSPSPASCSSSTTLPLHADLADAMAVHIRNDDVAVAIHCHAIITAKARLGLLAVAKALLDAPRDDRDLHGPLKGELVDVFSANLCACSLGVKFAC